MSGAVKREERNEYCTLCSGDGMRWLDPHPTNPSVKHRWSTCERCRGNGIEPKAERNEEEE